MPRSSLEDRGELVGGDSGRKNPPELHKRRFLIRRASRSIRCSLNPRAMDWRNYRKRAYAQGRVREFDASGLGAPSDFRAVDPDCREAMAVLRAGSERRERKDHDAAAA